MRFTLFLPRFFVATLAVSMITCGLAQGQTPTVNTTVAAGSAPPMAIQVKTPVEQRTEHMLLEDASAVIDEVRVGGESKSITVLPKSGLPAYQVAPMSGERSWKILGF
jgi:hypothetical protein